MLGTIAFGIFGLAVLVGLGLELLGPVELWLGTPVSLRSLVPEAAQWWDPEILTAPAVRQVAEV